MQPSSRTQTRTKGNRLGRATLLCPVRGCYLPLAREERRVVCERQHSFDIARSGYINLLQPQDRRSKHPGDTDAAVAARRRLHDHGVTEPLLRGLAALIRANSDDVALDAGCGDGFYLGTLARETGFEAHGIDLSARAVDLAARRFPEVEWIVGNADRRLPYAGGAFSIVLSITGRMHPTEFRRVLQDRGKLLVAVPAPDDLIELRGAGRDRAARTAEMFAGEFKLIEQSRVATTADLDAAAVQDVLVSVYRPIRAKPAEAMRLTLSLDLMLFQVP